jgi:hypothetical protein
VSFFYPQILIFVDATKTSFAFGENSCIVVIPEIFPFVLSADYTDYADVLFVHLLSA